MQAVTVSPEILEFRRLYDAGALSEARFYAYDRLRFGAPPRFAWIVGLGLVACREGNLEEALSIFLSGASDYHDSADYELRSKYAINYAMALKGMGLKLGDLTYLDAALIVYEEGRHAAQRVGADEHVARCENNIASTLIALERPGAAHPYLQSAQILFNSLGMAARAAEVEDTRALAYEAEGNLDEALECARRAEKTLRGFGESERGAWLQAVETHDRIWSKVRERAECR
jgi:tetratricopeptide (TPR) repeat protein